MSFCQSKAHILLSKSRKAVTVQQHSTLCCQQCADFFVLFLQSLEVALLLFLGEKIKEHLTETRKNLGFLLKNANSAPEVRKTMAMVDRRNYIGDTVKVGCSLIVCCRQILSFFSILHSASSPQTQC